MRAVLTIVTASILAAGCSGARQNPPPATTLAVPPHVDTAASPVYPPGWRYYDPSARRAREAEIARATALPWSTLSVNALGLVVDAALPAGVVPGGAAATADDERAWWSEQFARHPDFFALDRVPADAVIAPTSIQGTQGQGRYQIYWDRTESHFRAVGYLSRDFPSRLSNDALVARYVGHTVLLERRVLAYETMPCDPVGAMNPCPSSPRPPAPTRVPLVLRAEHFHPTDTASDLVAWVRRPSAPLTVEVRLVASLGVQPTDVDMAQVRAAAPRDPENARPREVWSLLDPQSEQPVLVRVDRVTGEDITAVARCVDANPFDCVDRL